KLTCLRPELARVTINFNWNDHAPDLTVSLEVASRAAAAAELGIRAFCLDLACETIRARLLPGLYSGWSCEGRSLVVFPVYEHGRPRQLGLVCDSQPLAAGDIRTRRQGLALNLPTGLFNGVALMDPGETWSGGLVIRFGADDIWDPALARPAAAFLKTAVGIQPPRHSYQTHITRWERLLKQPELWLSLGPGLGMYHRGFYGMIRFGETRVSGPLLYRGYQGQGTSQEHLVELAWGGSSNALLAYTMAHYPADWSRQRARQIAAAAVRFKGNGFQAGEGPCRGAWYNGYLWEMDRFSDRYGRESIYTPDQGITNYFLGKLLLEKTLPVPGLAEKIRTNCFEYLRSLRNRQGGLENARKFDGSPGVDRYELPYDGHKADLPMASAMGALSFLICYQLTGEAAAREEGQALLDHLREKIAANEWRFHEYDTWGWDNMAMCWILVTLCEWQAAFPEMDLAAPIEKTLAALLSCQHRFDFELDRYSQLERCWGGLMVNRGGWAVGTTVGSLQAGKGLHNRFDTALALWTHFRLTGDTRSYTALLEFLNYLTYHQWTRNDLPLGPGAVTEAMHLNEGHIQDTVQTLHSNCLHHILLNRGLFLESASLEPDRVKLPAPNGTGSQLRFSFRPGKAGPVRFSIDGAGSDNIELKLDGQVVYRGPGRNLNWFLPEAGRTWEFTAESVK
ncbi:MAG TPA: hypothetical protein PKN80_05145, partial [bacterium]|nr:hypothetical protein [bacterium]